MHYRHSRLEESHRRSTGQMRAARPAAAAWLLAVLVLEALQSDAYQDGDYVAISRRGQFHEVIHAHTDLVTTLSLQHAGQRMLPADSVAYGAAILIRSNLPAGAGPDALARPPGPTLPAFRGRQSGARPSPPTSLMQLALCA